MEMPFALLGFITGLIVGAVVITYSDVVPMKREAYQRGHMVECLGKSGYYWECE